MLSGVGDTKKYKTVLASGNLKPVWVDKEQKNCSTMQYVLYDGYNKQLHK